ncbi:Uncharacterized protein Fot_28524 [Forsythia ovata]|uniref:Disease resistance N-terminal domain-containing protein n=1 Tax=Forsythia ovata TaxID=205694 RepID=A0ABD1TPN9_9LAMI
MAREYIFNQIKVGHAEFSSVELNVDLHPFGYMEPWLLTMAIGEVFLSACVGVFLERLASRKLLKFLSPLGIDAQLKKWRGILWMIQTVLTDAENKQTRNEAVKKW